MPESHDPRPRSLLCSNGDEAEGVIQKVERDIQANDEPAAGTKTRESEWRDQATGSYARRCECGSETAQKASPHAVSSSYSDRAFYVYGLRSESDSGFDLWHGTPLPCIRSPTRWATTGARSRRRLFCEVLQGSSNCDFLRITTGGRYFYFVFASLTSARLQSNLRIFQVLRGESVSGQDFFSHGYFV